MKTTAKREKKAQRSAIDEVRWSNKEIKDKTLEVSEDNSLSIFEICHKNGIEVFEMNFELENDTDDETSWVFIYRKKENRKIIGVKKTDALVRRRFTIAHELWHYFLHKYYRTKSSGFIDTSQNFAVMYRKGEFSEAEKNREREANYFAANLLMPEKLVKKAFDKTDNIIDIAEVFWVSAVAMSIRLNNLWLIPQNVREW